MAKGNKSEVLPPPVKYYDRMFPSPIAPDAIKKTPEFGLYVAKAIYNSEAYGYSSYVQQRNTIFYDNTIFANGKQPFQTYLDLLGVDANQAFLNLDYHPRPVAPKFRDILVNDIMNRIEVVDCTGLSLQMDERKKRRKSDAAFRMENQEFIQNLQAETGMQFEDRSDYVPETEDDLDLWSQLNDKEREELLMEEGIEFALYNNDWDSIKREISIDLVEKGMAASRTYFDGRNRIRIKKIQPKQLIYGPTTTLDFRQVPYMAHVEPLSIVDCRTMFKNISEKELYEVAYLNRGQYGNDNNLPGSWDQSWEGAYNRPYDGFVVNVLFYEYRVVKYLNYVKGVDGNSNKIFDLNSKVGPDNPNKKNFSSSIPTIYQGAWVVGMNKPLMWGEMRNLLRSNEDVEDVKFSYSVYMLNNSGDMIPKSPIEAMKSSIIAMDLAILRIQHVLATTPPNGIRVDIDSWVDIDLGKGIGDVDALKMTDIWRQTGSVYYSGKAISSEGKGWHSPIEQQLNTIGDTIREAIGVYNFELNNIRDYIGVNEVKDGSGVNPRIGLQVMQNQISASNTATAHIYDAFINIMTNTSKCIGIMLWDTLKSADTNSMYVKMLGQKNADFIRERKNITSCGYLTKVSINMSQQDAQFLESAINSALQAGSIEFEDALMVRNLAKKNIDYAIKYLSFVRKKRAKEAMDAEMAKQAEMQKNNSLLLQQQQSEKSAQDQKTEELTIQKNREQAEIQRIKDEDKLIADCMVASMSPDMKPIPDYVLAIIARREQERQLAAKQEMLAQQEEAEMAMQQEQQQMGEMQEFV